MQKPLLLLFFLIVLLYGCAGIKTARPLKHLDFKKHSWQIVYSENESYEFGKYIKSTWLLNDSRVTDSLKDQYKCALKKQCDGDHEYSIYTFKDHIHSGRNLFCDDRYFSLGVLKQYLVPVNPSYIHCINRHSVKITTDSLESLGVPYTVTPTDTVNRNYNEFAVILDLDINTGSKLFQNNDTLLNPRTPNTQKELTRLFPGSLINEIPASEISAGWEPPVPGYLQNVNYHIFHHTVRFIISPEQPFKPNVSRLKETDLIRDYYVCTMYVVTAYIKK